MNHCSVMWGQLVSPDYPNHIWKTYAELDAEPHRCLIQKVNRLVVLAVFFAKSLLGSASNGDSK